MNAPQEQSITRPVPELFGRNAGYGFAGFGVSTAIGNYTDSAVDLGFPGGLLGLLDVRRTYNSLSATGGALGTGWTASFSVSLVPAAVSGSAQPAQATATPVTFNAPDGRVLVFTPDPSGGYTRPQDLDADLVRNADGSYTLTYNSGLVLSFTAGGQATSQAWEGQTVSYDYDGSGRLTHAAHSAGPQLSLSYDSAGRLTQAATNDGRTVGYGYAADGTLATVTDAAGGITRYETTADGTFQVTDADGNVLVANHYDPGSGRVSRPICPPAAPPSSATTPAPVPPR